MKRGGIRTNRKYVIADNGARLIKYEIQGRKNKLWIPIVETDSKTKKQTPMIYDNLKEAEDKVKEIAKQIRGRNNANKIKK